jgi:1-deoxy-D-xylulose-5-phosphate reductoisomerase
MINYISSLDISSYHLTRPRSIVLLGSTGSIGTSTLKVIEKHRDLFSVIGLAGARNIELLASQARKFRPEYLAVLNNDLAEKLKKLLPSEYKPHILTGQDGYVELAKLSEADIILSAMVGAAGLAPTMAAVKSGKIILLANKESLVLAGHLIRKYTRASHSIILPVDSEHNAIFQALAGHSFQDACKIVLTASGGPFRGKSKEFLQNVTKAQALAHPNWSMGAKISIDSATMMNKGLEIIEAYHLFGIEPPRIEVLVHPQSIVHSLVAYKDGSFLAHLGIPDMQIPIAYCLAYPDRVTLNLKPLDLTQVGTLTFEPPDEELFPCLRLAKRALEAGPGYMVVLNAANEVAVDLFLRDRINFLQIPEIISRALDQHEGQEIDSLQTILELDARTRQLVISECIRYD